VRDIIDRLPDGTYNSGVKSSVIILAIFLYTCFQPLRFEVAQPDGLHDLKHIPRKLRGVYQVVPDTTYSSKFDYVFEQITISRSHITFIIEVSVKVLDSAVDIEEDLGWNGVDTMEYYRNGTVIKWNRRNDSIEMIGHAHDTVFSFYKDHILREYKGYFFMNRKNSRNTWEVEFLKPIENGMIYGQTDDFFDFMLFNQIGSSTYSENTDTFHPTKDQLMEFIDKKGFLFRSQFKKLKKNRLPLPRHPELCRPSSVSTFNMKNQ